MIGFIIHVWLLNIFTKRESIRLCFVSHNAFITLIELLLTLNVIKHFGNDDKKLQSMTWMASAYVLRVGFGVSTRNLSKRRPPRKFLKWSTKPPLALVVEQLA